MPSIISRYMRAMVKRGAQRNDRLNLADLRTSMERIARLIHPPRVVDVQQVAVGGIACEWIQPKSSHPKAAFLYLHGGAFCSGSPVTHRHLVGHISKLTGAAALVPAYRLAPEHTFPAALDDSVACYVHLLERGFSPDRIVIAGDSAGGNLALSMLIRLRDGGSELPAAAVCLSPVVDLARNDEKTKQADELRAPNDPMIRLHFVGPMIDSYVADHDPAAPLLSPLFADLRGLPPILVQAGGDELLLTDAEAITERARAAGVAATLQVYEGMWHVWQVFVPYLPEARRAVRAIARFIESHTFESARSTASSGGR